MAADFEKLGLFYLGKRYDLAAGKRLDDLILYDSKDLLTHAVCVGMTGSGKTGLGIGLIEEAAIDNIPVLAIDPKGDLPNLLLTFPNLAPEDFAPWIDAAEAERQGLTQDAFAKQTADRWKAGLAEWGEDGTRISRLRQAADVRVYTPGSRAGTPLALFGSLGQPASDDPEETQASISTTASSLLGLAGLNDVQAHSREQALLSAILTSGAPGAGADLRWVVQQIQRPSFTQVGVLDLETFYPAKDRQELALRFNSLLAAPGFEAWNAGEPLDIASMLFTPQGRPRIAVVSIAHLGDAERMLVVSMLLSALLQWTRRQGGTGSLRALVYMDEVLGYLPPVANPPSKLPLLTLLKQARAFGVGIVLATQNPVDLDYKALSNAGTWFLGKLQTERDKARVLDGLEGVAGGLDRQTLDKTLSALRSRVFLMHNVHEHEPVTLETRWTLSYLRGPMGRDDLRRFAATPRRGGSSDPPTTATITQTASPGLESKTRPTTAAATAGKPVLPVGVQEYYLAGDGRTPSAYAPVLYGAVLFSQVILPVYARLWTQGREALRPFFVRTTRFLFAVGAPVSATVWLVAPDVMRLLFPPEYAAGAGALAILSSAIVFVFCAYPHVMLLLAAGEQRLMMRISVAGAGESMRAVPRKRASRRTSNPFGASTSRLSVQCNRLTSKGLPEHIIYLCDES